MIRDPGGVWGIEHTQACESGVGQLRVLDAALPMPGLKTKASSLMARTLGSGHYSQRLQFLSRDRKYNCPGLSEFLHTPDFFTRQWGLSHATGHMGTSPIPLCRVHQWPDLGLANQRVFTH